MGLLNRLSKLGPVIGRVVDASTKSVISPVFGKAGEVLGKSLNVVGAIGSEAVNGLSSLNYRQIGKNIKNTGKSISASVGEAALDEVDHIGKGFSLFSKQLLGDAPLTTNYLGPDSRVTKLAKKTALLKRDESSILLGVKATGLGTALAFPAALAAGTPKAANAFVDMYKGSNDGQLYTNAPINTYGKALGNSYADNAGATGDLVFALHNQRHSGIV